MDSAEKAIQLYTSRSRSYLRFVNAFAYARGLRAYWEKSVHLKSGLAVLDAGCGTGIASMALRQAMVGRGLKPGTIKCFDITPQMLTIFREKVDNEAIEGVEIVQADVLHLDSLPVDWKDFDLIISAAMMEYLPSEQLVDALSGLRSRLSETGRMVLFITRKNWLMKLLITRWWHANYYHKSELFDCFSRAGFSEITFGSFPFPYKHLALWGHVVEAA
ncbi:methyltransferase domain-containing protein [Seongchinamella sediminis]|uniref:Methyltransferase domain-containing protein n=1 Tax=Seongchinamella sediminis TaxID=2283635 RepID=A0A3L7DSQ7_9GAMM|nr:class I SAM-dependent methyltransferase [Seongchinamella sediminis]RLQ20697.1 methyltransferase domain-containing protein [Seongchinamella sediminis]